MVFNFTFSFAVPGIPNPFSAAAPAPASTSADWQADKKGALHPPRRPHPTSLPPSQPLSRKRGWVPAEAEPTQPAMSSASSSGYLDTPAKYRDFTVTPDVRLEDDAEEMVADLPPSKRRRTIAGSIVSTAVSAALIGTAVGLTVYRLWRDRGKEPRMITAPPPPYERGDWSQPQDQEPLPVHIVPPTPRTKKPRPISTTVRRTPQRHRKQRSHGPSIIAAGPSTFTSPPTLSPVRPEFAFSTPVPAIEDQDEAEDSMDWVGSRLAQLIEEGKRALGKEVVVMSETAEDAEDDMSGNWVEDDDGYTRSASPSRSRSRRGSVRRKHHPQQPGIPSAYHSSPQPSMQILDRHSRHGSDEMAAVSSSFTEDSSAWQSPAMRDSMERARARYLQSRQ